MINSRGAFETSIDASRRSQRVYRGKARPLVEAATHRAEHRDKGLISEVIHPEQPAADPLEEYGLHSAPEADDLLLLFPDMFNDPLEQQAALACLLIKRKVSVAVTISASFAPVNGGPLGLKSTPLAFDLSHQDHRFVQAFMWTRCLGIADKVITFLKANVYDRKPRDFWIAP
jgi:hypothetical protein